MMPVSAKNMSNHTHHFDLDQIEPTDASKLIPHGLGQQGRRTDTSRTRSLLTS
jgi:hypothetical protein